ncbi:hypothetical protein O181_039593, partial [Austropuccinia psidii MF-1]|nr:hypothetical protein [Austropuccinia psidii MF-1]
FADNPAEDNQTTVGRLVEETCPSSQTPTVKKQKNAKKLVFQGPTIQDSEEEDPNTPSNQMEVNSEVEWIPQKEKERESSPVEQSPHKHLYEPVQEVLHGVQGQRLGNVAINTPRSDELLAYPENISQRGGNSEIHQWMEFTIIQASNQEDKGIPCHKGRNPSSFYQKSSSQPASPRRGEEQENKLEETIFPKLQDLKNPKRCHGQCLQHGQNLDGIQGQRGTKNKITSFPKERALSPDVVNTLNEIKNSILPLKYIRNSLLSLQEINNSLSSLTNILVQNKKEIDKIEFMVETNKPKLLIDNTQKLLQVKQELFKYIKDIEEKTLKINHEVSIDNLTEKLNKLSISVERVEEKTSSHQNLLLDQVENSYEARMNLNDAIQSEIRLIIEKMDKIN